MNAAHTPVALGGLVTAEAVRADAIEHNDRETDECRDRCNYPQSAHGLSLLQRGFLLNDLIYSREVIQ